MPHLTLKPARGGSKKKKKTKSLAETVLEILSMTYSQAKMKPRMLNPTPPPISRLPEHYRRNGKLAPLREANCSCRFLSCLFLTLHRHHHHHRHQSHVYRNTIGEMENAAMEYTPLFAPHQFYGHCEPSNVNDACIIPTPN